MTTITKLSLISVLTLTTIVTGERVFSTNRTNSITIKAHYMRYACGDDNIDMNVSFVKR